MEEASQVSNVFFSSLMFIALATVIFSWLLIQTFNQTNKKGPKTWPIIGATIEQLKNYDRMHDWLAEYLAKWKTITVSMPSTTYTYIADPANVEHVLKTNFTNYPKVKTLRTLVYGTKFLGTCLRTHSEVPKLYELKGELYRSYMDVLLGDGIFNADGELWRKQRKTASFEFASKNLRDFSANVFREYALKLSDILCEASTDNRVIDMQVNLFIF